MSTLVLALRADDVLLVNGATIVAQTKGRIVLKSPARFVLGKQYMPETEATTPARRLYWAVQQAYAGGEALDAEAVALAVQRFQDEASARLLVEAGAAAVDAVFAAEGGDGYAALKAVREIVKAEVALAAAQPNPEAGG